MVTDVIGVLALQGGFAAHVRALERAGYHAVEVRDVESLDHVKGLVLPGGESTTQWNLIMRHGLAERLDALVKSGMSVLATCAGLILGASRVTDPEQASFGWIDVTVARNAWGRQVASFQATSDEGAIPLTFIRAPKITAVGREAKVIATLQNEPIMVQTGNVFGATFHPELTDDRSVYRRVFG